MKRASFVFSFLTLFALGGTVRAAAPVMVAGSDLAVRAGVEGYSITDAEKGTPVVRLLDAGQQEIGTITYDVRKPGLVEARYVGVLGVVTVYWQPIIGKLEVVLPNETSASWQFDAATKAWVASGAAELVRAQFWGALELVAVTGQDVLENQGRGCARSITPSEAADAMAAPRSGRQTLIGEPCTPDYQVTGSYYNFQKSYACEQAKRVANEGCSNRWCWGCCQVSDCNCVCFPGSDFYCLCLAYGKPCAGPPPTPVASCGGGDPGGWNDPGGRFGAEYQDPGTCLDPSSVCCGASPILLNLDGAGFELSGANDPVTFDLFASGSAQRYGWTSRTSKEGFLVLDRNGDGKITSGAELFGNHTPLPDGSVAPNGYVALAAYDSNHDGVIDARDDVFPHLRVWIDSNHNGISEPGELHTLAELRIVRIDLKYRDSRRRDRFGNLLRYWSHATVLNAKGEEKKIDTCDVFFVRVKD